MEETLRSGKIRLWAVLLLAAIGACGWHYQAQLNVLITKAKDVLGPKAPTKPPQRIPVVGTAPVTRRDVPVYLNGLGTVTAFHTVTVRSRVEGELLEVPIDEGQFVKEGDLLALIDPRNRQAELEQAEGQLARDEATLKGAKLTLDRYKLLLESSTIAQQQVDEQQSLVQQAEAAVRTDRATIANARLQLEYCRITAPISGRIGLRLVDPGNVVQANDPNGLAVITQLQPISLLFTIPQDDIAQVTRRYRAGEPLTVDVFDREFRNQIASGKLTAVDNQVDSATGTLRLKAEFENKDEVLFPNQFVNARLHVDTLKDATVVPSAALQRGPDFQFVYVLGSDLRVTLRRVVTGIVSGTESVVISGLEPGEIVVTDGLDKLQSGATVKISSSTEETGGAPADGSSSEKGSPDTPGKANGVPGDAPADPRSTSTQKTDTNAETNKQSTKTEATGGGKRPRTRVALSGSAQ